MVGTALASCASWHYHELAWRFQKLELYVLSAQALMKPSEPSLLCTSEASKKLHVGYLGTPSDSLIAVSLACRCNKQEWRSRDPLLRFVLVMPRSRYSCEYV